MNRDRERIAEASALTVDRLLAKQCLDPASRDCGGFPDPATAYADSRNSIYAMQVLFAAYLTPLLPRWHGDPGLLRRLEHCLGFMRRRQRANGTVMLGANAAPCCAEVAFTVPGVLATWERARASALPGAGGIAAALETYLVRAGGAIRVLRPMTSNHRWTACAGPLALLQRHFPHPDNRRVIDDLVEDGLDISPEGMWFEERSPNYNMVADWGMLWLADGLGERRFLEAAWRNCRLSLRLRQPIGEADTTFSHRQDRGVAGKAFAEWWPMRRLALEFGDGELAAAADELAAAFDPEAIPLLPLAYCAEDPRLAADAVPRRPQPTACELTVGEWLWRWRDGARAATVVADPGGHWWDHVHGTWGAPLRGATVLSLHHGAAIIDGFKLVWGTAAGCFRPERIVHRSDGVLVLEAEDYGFDHQEHYRPAAKRRPPHLPYDQPARLEIRRDGDGFAISGEIAGEPDCPVNLHLLLRASGRLQAGDGAARPLAAGGATFSAGGAYLLSAADGAGIRITGLPASESTYRLGDGASICGQAERDAHRLIVAGFTPFRFAFRLDFAPASPEGAVGAAAEPAAAR